MTAAETLEQARSMLFVPASRPDRFAKAAAAGADAVILDLEDAVGVAGKDAARGHVAEYLEQGHSPVVRINAPGTPWYGADVAMLARYRCPVMLPKAADPEAVTELVRRLPHAAVLALVETAAGVSGAEALCRTEGVLRLAFGNIDLASQLGIDSTDHQALVTARSTLVLAAASAAAPAPLDGVTTAVEDATQLTEDAGHAARLGFSGKLCVHPKQLTTVHDAFTPSQEAVRWAHAVNAAETEGSVAVLDGEMIDKPVLDRARSILRRAGQLREQP